MFNESMNTTQTSEIFDSKYYIDVSVAYATLILSIFGLFGNIIAIFIFLSPSMRTVTTNIYLTALSFSNILYLILHIFQYFLGNLLIHNDYRKSPFYESLFSLIGCLPHSPLLMVTLYTNIYLTIALSIDRFIIVKYSLKAKTISTKRLAIFVIFAIYLTSLIYSIPYWFLQDYDFQERKCEYELSNQIKFHKYYRLPVLRIIPCLILTFINIQILRNLITRKHQKQSLRVDVKRRRHNDVNITLMFVMNIAISILSGLVEIVLVVWMESFFRDSTTMILYEILYAISKILDIFDPLSECTLYFCFVQKFRQLLKEYICRLRHCNRGQTVRTLFPRLPINQTKRILLKYDLKISVEISSTVNQNVVVPSPMLNNESSHPYEQQMLISESKI